MLIMYLRLICSDVREVLVRLRLWIWALVRSLFNSLLLNDHNLYPTVSTEGCGMWVVFLSAANHSAVICDLNNWKDTIFGSTDTLPLFRKQFRISIQGNEGV